jgi:MFS family permease
MIVSEPLFWGPIVIYSLLNLAHMSLSEIFLMESVVMTILVLSNIPAGALADSIGKKRAVLIGRVFLLISISCFATMANPLSAWIGNISWAIGFALTSGSESSLLYETLASSGSEHQFRRVQGKAVGLRFLVAALSCLLVGVLASIHPRLPLYLSIPGMFLALLLVLPMKEPIQTQSFSWQMQLLILKNGVAFVLKTPVVLWMVAFAALIGAISKVWFFTYNPYFELVGVPLSHYGIIFFLLNVVAWLSSHYAHQIESKASEFGLIVFSLACLVIPITIMALFPAYVVVYFVLAQNIVRGFIRPFTEDFVHHHISTEQARDSRATIMSVKSAASQLAMVIGLAVAGIAFDYFPLTIVLSLLALTALVLGVGISVWYLRVVKNK